MTRPSQARVEALYHAAMAIEPERRAEYLADACGEDGETRREVASLLRAAERASGFIAGAAIDDAARAIAGADLPLTGSIGSYDIEALIGRGGMGEVYRAEDPRLGRDVALKILPEPEASDPSRRQRFDREARAYRTATRPGGASGGAGPPSCAAARRGTR